MGRGYTFRPTYTDRNGEKKQSSIWWIGYSVNGEKVRKSTGSTVEADADAMLARELAKLRSGGPLPHELERFRFEDLAELIREDYKAKGRKSNIEYPLAHLTDAFGGWPVVDIREAEIRRYRSSRLKEDAANATVNRELAALRRMFNLGRREGLVGSVPAISDLMLPENNTRTGFLREKEFRKLIDALPPRLKPLVEIAYVTGWRKGELLSRTWAHVDFEHGWLRLEPGETKSGSGRQFPLIPDLRSLLEAQRERKQETEREYGCEVTALFFYYEPSRNGLPAGRPIKSFRRAWKTAAKAAGVPGLLFHDLRRSSVRNLIRAGIPEKLAMEYSGHETREIFDRYDILDEATLREGGAKIQAFRDKNGSSLDKDTGKVEAEESREPQATQ